MANQQLPRLLLSSSDDGETVPASMTMTPDERTRLLAHRQSVRSDLECYEQHQQRPQQRSEGHEPPPLLQLSSPSSSSSRTAELKGLIVMGLSSLGSATMSALVKANSNSGFPSLEIVFFRSLIQLVGAVIGALIAGVNPLGPPNSELRGWLMLRGFIGGLGIIAFFSSVTILPLADANVVFFTNPILTSLIAHYILGEDYSLTDKALSFVCMLGVVLVSKPSTLFTLSSPYFAATTTTTANTASDVLPASSDAGGSIMRALGVAVAFVGALCAASAYTLVRKIGKNVHFTVQVTYLGLVCTVMSGIPLLFSIQSFHLPASLNDWSMLVSVGLCAVFSQMLLNRGLQLAPAGPAILMRNLDVVFAYVFSVAVFNEIPDIMSIVGSTVIIGCTVALGVSRWLKSRRHSRRDHGSPP